jgi:hypothetical protein
VDAHEVFRDDLNEILHQVVGKQRLCRSDGRIFIQPSQLSEVVLCRKHSFERIEDGILSLFVDFVAAVLGRCQQGLELFDHYKLDVKKHEKAYKTGHHCSLEVHLSLATTTASRIRAARRAAAFKFGFPETVEVCKRAKLTHCTFRVLVFLYLWDFAHTLPNSLQLLQRAHLFGVNFLKEIDSLVYEKVNDADLSEKPWVEFAFLLIQK